MAVPQISELLPVFLQQLQDGNTYKMSTVIERITDYLALPPEDRQAILKSGEPVIANRLWWLNTHCYHAGLLERPSRGEARLTAKGLDVVREHVPVSMAWIRQQPEYQAWTQSLRNRTAAAVAAASADADVADKTPLEVLEANHRDVRNSLADELLERVRMSTPSAFERLVVKLLVAMGYGGGQDTAAHVVGGSGDGGIDGVINADPLGLDVLYVQAKQWQDTVGEPVVRDFVGSLVGKHATKGVLITTSAFSAHAVSYSKGLPQKVILIDGDRLVDFMIQFGVGVTEVASYIVHRVDGDFFEEL